MLASIREFAPWVDSMIVAGVAGTAITADLGARKIREELDALQVLGVDPVKNLVVPRFLALMLVTGLLDVYALIFGIFGGILAEMVYHQNLAGFWATFFANASVTDLWGSRREDDDVRRDHRDRVLLQGHDRNRWCGRGGPSRERGGRDRLRGDLGLQLRVHPNPAGDAP